MRGGGQEARNNDAKYAKSAKTFSCDFVLLALLALFADNIVLISVYLRSSVEISFYEYPDTATQACITLRQTQDGWF